MIMTTPLYIISTPLPHFISWYFFGKVTTLPILYSAYSVHQDLYVWLEKNTWHGTLVFQFSSLAQLCPTLCNPWTATCQASLSITNSQSLLKLKFIELVMPFDHLALCGPFLLLPSVFPCIRVFSNELVLRIRRPKYWSFRLSITASNEHSGLMSFRMDWLDLLAIQGTLKNLCQHHSSKVSSINSG